MSGTRHRRLAVTLWAAALWAVSFSQVCSIACGLDSCLETPKPQASEKCAAHHSGSTEKSTPSEGCKQHSSRYALVQADSPTVAGNFYSDAFFGLSGESLSFLSTWAVPMAPVRDHGPPTDSGPPIFLTAGSLRI